MDPAGHIQSWNPGAEHIFGYAADEVVGRDFAMLFTPEDRQADAPGGELRKAMQTGRADDQRWHLRKDGSRFFASGAPDRDPGRTRRAVSQGRTGHHPAEAGRGRAGRLLAAAEAARAEAEAASRMKDEFLATL